MNALIENRRKEQAADRRMVEANEKTQHLYAIEKREKVILELEERVKELQSLRQWQPIETAPKDGKEILVLLENKDIHIVYGHYYARGEKFEWAQFDGVNNYNPTHWMTMPPTTSEDV